MEQGDTLICRLDKGGKITVTLDDRVYPDRSAGQYEAGWWVFEEDILGAYVKHGGGTDTGVAEYGQLYFLSESGILYEWQEDWPQGGFTKACGIHVPWARRVKQADMELEQFARDEQINRSFDAYR